MKKFLMTTAVMVAALTAPAVPAFAMGEGLTAGSEARGEPINSSVHISAREPGRMTPGGEASARAQYYGKAQLKKKRAVTTRGSVKTYGR